jgi:hypothetical protein
MGHLKNEKRYKKVNLFILKPSVKRLSTIFFHRTYILAVDNLVYFYKLIHIESNQKNIIFNQYIEIFVIFVRFFEIRLILVIN